MLRLVLSIEVIKVAEELVEAMHGRQELIAVPEMVLAELSGHIAERLEQFGECRILFGETFFRTRQPNFQKAGPHWALSGDKRSAAGRAGLLTVIVREDRTLVGETVDVGRAIAHHSAIVGADVPVADVIGHDDEDVGFLLLRAQAGTIAAIADASDTKRARQIFLCRLTAISFARLLNFGRRFSYYGSNAKMRFQSFFMLTTIQPLFLASSSSSCVKVPTLVSGRPSAGP